MEFVKKLSDAADDICKYGHAWTVNEREDKKGLMLRIEKDGYVHGSGPLGEFVLKTALEGCRPEGIAGVAATGDNKVSVIRRLRNPEGQECCVCEKFSQEAGSILWEIEITGESVNPWSAPIASTIRYAATGRAEFWTAWDAPADSGDVLADPLKPSPLASKVYSYGAPRFRIERPAIPWWNWSQRPDGENYISVPLFTAIEPEIAGISLMASPEPIQLDMELAVDKNGKAGFTWYRYRVSGENPVRLVLHLISHEDDWRGGIRWMAKKYGKFFTPPNPLADGLSGAGVYTSYSGELDVETLRKMAFSFNWRASFNFPYIGMFLPPVGPEEKWMSFCHKMTSMADMEKYSQKMKEYGFKVLEYFNVTDFGTKIEYPPRPRDKEDMHDVWKNADWHDANEYLFSRFGAALIRVPDGLPLADIEWPPQWEKTKPGGLYYSWEYSVGLDCGEPVYHDYLLEQAKRHLDMLPGSSGICIDRMDWLRLFNLDRDDGISWFDGAPARSLIWSWRYFMDRLGLLMHGAGKVIFVNPLVKRLDLMQHVDGFFDECADENGAFNGTAIIAVYKPAVVFRNSPVPIGQEDSFFQRHLHLGVYPMCPYPENDHGLVWGTEEVRQPFVDYGPLLDAMKGKKWVLEPCCIRVVGNNARVNLFEVPEGWAVPVTYGKDALVVKVEIRNIPGISGSLRMEVLHPGIGQPYPVKGVMKEDVLELSVPLHRGCAMIRIWK